MAKETQKNREMRVCVKGWEGFTLGVNGCVGGCQGTGRQLLGTKILDLKGVIGRLSSQDREHGKYWKKMKRIG